MNFVVTLQRMAVVAMLAAILRTPLCGAEEGATVTPPQGWTVSVVPTTPKGLELLFTGKRADRTGQMSTLVVSHSLKEIGRQDARDYLGDYLDTFAKRDPYLFLQASLEKLHLGGRCAVYIKVLGRNLHPRKEDSHTYVFMTEAGIFNVQFTAEGDDQFNIEDFMKESFSLSAKEAEFAGELADVFVETLPKIKVGERKRLEQLNRELAEPSITNQPPDFISAALGVAAFGLLETSAYLGTNAFEAKVMVDVCAASGARRTMPLTVQKSGQKTRTEARLVDFGMLPASVKAELQRLSLERLVAIFDSTTERLQIILPDADAYLEIQAPFALSEAVDNSTRLSLVPLTTEEWQGHLCEKVQFSERGRTNLPVRATMVAWNRPDLDKFPIKIAVTRSSDATVLTTDSVDFRNGVSTGFEVPAGFVRYATSAEVIKAMERKHRAHPAEPK